MGSYRQHVGLASFLGAGYAWSLYALAGLHWVFGTVAALLATVGGLLPDLDSKSGVGTRGLNRLFGVLTAFAVWREAMLLDPPLSFELHVWAIILAYALIRHSLCEVMSRVMVHRGMSHSVPTCLVWGCSTYLLYPSPYHVVRTTMAVAVMLGFLSHLVLDEVCSVDLAGARVNKAFGSALKFWARSIWATLGVYALLAFLAWRVIEVWPTEPSVIAMRVPSPAIDFRGLGIDWRWRVVETER